ncbi:hypothetical protein LCGC14_2407070 [marine sediment metagenome]|uniref:Right handed beta helix domain-containing protein n=1 Tax=marine sediment metagenome TaxID=412755 RepID=A0A0F9EN46_9ZZZZ
MPLTNFPNGLSSFGVPVLPGLNGLTALNKVYFVDGVNGLDSRTGLSVDQAFATIQKAVNTVVHRDAILVLPHAAAGADYDETVTTPLNNATSGNAANGVTLMGVSNTVYGDDAPQIFPNTGGGNCLVVRAPGWRISGLTFAVPTTSTMCIQLNLAQAAKTDNTSYAPHTQVDNCRFRGLVAAGVGIQFTGAPHDVRILNNVFDEFTDNCIECPNSSTALPNRCLVMGNHFMNSTHGINMPLRGFNNSHIIGNIFSEGDNTIVTIINITGGRNNVINRNVFPGDYSTAAARFGAGTGDEWSGNYSSDTSETEVGASGLTVGAPVA